MLRLRFGLVAAALVALLIFVPRDALAGSTAGHSASATPGLAWTEVASP